LGIGFTRRGFLVAGAAAVLSGCSSVGGMAGTGGATTPAVLSVVSISSAINRTRKHYGAKALVYNRVLEKAARNHAELMASRHQISHTLGGTLRQRVNAVDYHGAVGENLAVGYDTLEGAIDGWLKSPGHRSTLLNTRFSEFGLAAASDGKKVYWAFIAGGDIAAWRT
jgi:uncharacterized protein YkwD